MNMAISIKTFQIMLNFENHAIFHSTPMRNPEDDRFRSPFNQKTLKETGKHLPHFWFTRAEKRLEPDLFLNSYTCKCFSLIKHS